MRFIFAFSIFFISMQSVAEDPSEKIYYVERPDWVTQPTTKLDSKINKEPNISVRYLHNNQQYNISGKKKHYYNHVVMQPVNENGLQHVAEISFSFNPKFQQLQIHHIEVTRGGEKSNRLVPSKIKVLNEDASLKDKQINGRVTALAILQDIRIGDVISYAYSINGSNPVLGEKHFGYFATSWSVPIENLYLRLLTKKNGNTYISESKFNYQQTARPNFIEHIWQTTDTEAVAQEDRLPSWYTPYSSIEFTEYKNWKEVNDWAYPLYNDRTLSDSLKVKINLWKTQLKTPEERIEAALQFVQDEVRYFGIEIGQNTHKPFSPGIVFDRRYGDCKDKTTLLITILESFGFNAYPALVSSYAGKVLNERLPSPGAFDHVIVKLEYNGKNYWLDGTVSHQRGGIENMGFIDYKQALIVKKREKKLTKVIPPEGNRYLIETKETYAIKEENHVTELSVETIYHGLQADILRNSVASNGKKALAENFLNFYSQSFPKIESFGEFNLVDDTSKNKIRVLSNYRIKDWTTDKSGKKIVSVYVPEIRDYLPSPASLVRQHPFYVAENLQLNYQQTIRSSLHKPISFDDSGFQLDNIYFQYSKSVKHLDNGASVSHIYRAKAAHVEADQTADYIEKVNLLKENLGFNIIFPTNFGKPVKNQQKRLKDLAKKLLNKS